MNNTYIKSGTSLGAEALCKTCARALIIIGHGDSEQVTVCRCAEPNIVLHFIVRECTGYLDKNRPDWFAIDPALVSLRPAGKVCNEDLD
jgi:hypothetical protein